MLLEQKLIDAEQVQQYFTLKLVKKKANNETQNYLCKCASSDISYSISTHLKPDSVSMLFITNTELFHDFGSICLVMLSLIYANRPDQTKRMRDFDSFKFAFAN